MCIFFFIQIISKYPKHLAHVLANLVHNGIQYIGAVHTESFLSAPTLRVIKHCSDDRYSNHTVITLI